MSHLVTSRIMRTTIDLDATVLRDLKRRATREGKSLGRVASELLAAGLADDNPPVDAGFRWTTRTMEARVNLDDKEAVRKALEGG